MHLLAELKRRHVLRVAVAYAVTSWLLIEVADTIFPRLALPEWTVTLVIALLALGFPLALVFAWFFELTPEGLQRTATDPADHAETHAAMKVVGRRLDYWVIALLSIALGYFFWESRWQSTDSPAASASGPVAVAVMPFVNISPDPNQEYFSDGLTEELLNMLARVSGLRVAARTSTLRFKDSQEPVADIGHALNVRYLLTGSVRKAGETLRINSQIVKVDDGYVMWSTSYDRGLSDIFQIQQEIATAVTDALKVRLLNSDKLPPRIDPAAYNLVLLGRYHGLRFGVDDIRQAISSFQQAIAIDPEYAAAWANLSQAQSRLPDFGAATPQEGYTAARHSAERALELDPKSAEAHLALAWIQQNYDYDWIGTRDNLQQAYALEPGNERVLRRLGTFEMIIGHTTRALDLFQSAIEIDPLNPGSHHNLGLAYLAAGRYTDSEQAFRTALRLDSNGKMRHAALGSALLLQGRLLEAAAEIERETDDFWRQSMLAMLYHSLQRPADSDALLATLEETYGNEWAYQIAEIYAWRGAADLAFSWLERARRQNDSGIVEINISPYFRKLQDDPRLAAFIATLHFPQ